MNVQNHLQDISFMEYYLFPAAWHTILSDYYVNTIRQESGEIIGLYTCEELVSYAILNNDIDYTTISYLWTKPERRNQGFATELVRQIFLRKDILYRLHLTSTQPDYQSLTAIAQTVGFRAITKSTVFTGNTDDSMWKRMDALPLDRMSALLLSHGGKCCSFDQLTESECALLKYSVTSEFHNSLDPVPYLNNPGLSLAKNLSFAMIRDEQLLSYSLVTRPTPQHVIVEHISSAEKLLGMGHIVVPLSRTLAAIRADSTITKLSMTISNQNAASRNFTLSMLKGVELKEVNNITYYYHKRM